MNTNTLNEDPLFAGKIRSWIYVVIYLLLLALLWVLISNGLIPYISKMIPIKLFIWIAKHLSVHIGLFSAVLSGIFLYPLVERGSTLGITQVYTNRFINTDRGICYGNEWAIGNILERFVTSFESFIVAEEIEKDKPLDAKAVDDTLRIWGAYTITIQNPRVLQYGLKHIDILKKIKAIVLPEILTLIESFTSSKKSEDILGHGELITKHVMSSLNNQPCILGKGFKVEWITGNIDESKEASEARTERKSAEQFAYALDMLESKGENLYDKDGNPRRGALTREEAAAVLISRDQNARGTFSRNVDERIVRVEGDPEVLKALKGTGILFGLGHEHEAEGGAK